MKPKTEVVWQAKQEGRKHSPRISDLCHLKHTELPEHLQKCKRSNCGGCRRLSSRIRWTASTSCRNCNCKITIARVPGWQEEENNVVSAGHPVCMSETHRFARKERPQVSIRLPSCRKPNKKCWTILQILSFHEKDISMGTHLLGDSGKAFCRRSYCEAAVSIRIGR